MVDRHQQCSLAFTPTTPGAAAVDRAADVTVVLRRQEAAHALAQQDTTARDRANPQHTYIFTVLGSWC